MPFNVARICPICNQLFAVRRPSDPNKFCGRKCQFVHQSETSTPLSVRFWKHVTKTDTCWLWGGSGNNKGYGQIITAPKSRGGKLILAHRASWEIHYGQIPNGMGVLHRCDNPPCVRPDHLFLGDQVANMQDCASKSRTNQGERCPAAKLNADQVREIRIRYANGGISQSTLAKEYGINQPNIGALIRHETWKHID